LQRKKDDLSELLVLKTCDALEIPLHLMPVLFVFLAYLAIKAKWRHERSHPCPRVNWVHHLWFLVDFNGVRQTFSQYQADKKTLIAHHCGSVDEPFILAFEPGRLALSCTRTLTNWHVGFLSIRARSKYDFLFNAWTVEHPWYSFHYESVFLFICFFLYYINIF
jgi:hypothetical protein